MSKVTRKFTGFMDTFPVPSGSFGVVSGSWHPGNLAIVNDDGYAVPYAGGTTVVPMGMFIDDTDELVAPPSGVLVTLMHGKGRVVVDAEDATDATHVFAGSLAGFTPGLPLYATSEGKLCITYNGTPSATAGKVQVGTVVSGPTADNGYTLDMLLSI